MPRDLFGAVVVRPSSVRRFRRGIVIVSVIAHVVTLSVLLVADVLAVGPLPEPRRPAGFEWISVRLADIELPPAPAPHVAAPRETTATADNVNAAPTQVPTGITPETGFESAPRNIVPGEAVAIEHGLEAGIDRFGSPVAPPPPPPQIPVRLHSGIQPPRKVVDATPDYPALARQARVEGIVIIEATIDVRGDVQSAKVLRSIPLLDDAAVAAVRQWKFTPALLNGVPVPVIITVTVNFKLQ
jgi:protein TonB